MLAVRSMIVAGLAMAGSGMAIRVVKGSDPTSTGSASEVTATDDVSAGRKVPGGGNGNYPTGSEFEKEMEAELQKIAEEEEKYDAERKANVIKVAEELMKKDPKLTKEEAEESAEEEVQLEEMEQFQKEFEQVEEQVEQQFEVAAQQFDAAIKEAKKANEADQEDTKNVIDTEINLTEEAAKKYRQNGMTESAAVEAANKERNAIDAKAEDEMQKEEMKAAHDMMSQMLKPVTKDDSEVAKVVSEVEKVTDELTPMKQVLDAIQSEFMMERTKNIYVKKLIDSGMDEESAIAKADEQIEMIQRAEHTKFRRNKKLAIEHAKEIVSMEVLENKPPQGTQAPSKVATGRDLEPPTLVTAPTPVLSH